MPKRATMSNRTRVMTGWCLSVFFVTTGICAAAAGVCALEGTNPTRAILVFVGIAFGVLGTGCTVIGLSKDWDS